MSQFIEGVRQFSSEYVIKVRPKQIIIPQIKRYMKTNQNQDDFDRKKQNKIMNKICQRLSVDETDKIRLENQAYFHQRYSILKKKMVSAFNPIANGKSVLDFFKNQELTLEQQLKSHEYINTKKLANGMPRKIELQKKYNANVNIRMMAVKEAQEISFLKENYQKWFDKEKNKPISSPNFNKMIFLLEKLNFEKQNLKKQNKKELSQLISTLYVSKAKMKGVRNKSQKKCDKTTNNLYLGASMTNNLYKTTYKSRKGMKSESNEKMEKKKIRFASMQDERSLAV